MLQGDEPGCFCLRTPGARRDGDGFGSLGKEAGWKAEAVRTKL